jgi:hypothetical protein
VLDGPTPTNTPIVVEGEEERQTTSVAAEFLRYHQKFGHISPKKIQVSSTLDAQYMCYQATFNRQEAFTTSGEKDLK